ncbi:hypothetical protein VE03_05543 [Pseudogymnoascus sp. 23342-1-I1]|nr:hypothetical protein VE03_05543 [Pseudogymnoascus sp. 23342-1-I1]
MSSSYASSTYSYASTDTITDAKQSSSSSSKPQSKRSAFLQKTKKVFAGPTIEEEAARKQDRTPTQAMMENPPSTNSMEDTLTATAYLLAPEGDRRSEIAEKVAKGLEDGSIKLREVVLSMEGPLFATDAEQRAQSIVYIAGILSSLKPDTLTRANVTLLVKFLESRLTLDPAGLKETAQSLRSLSAMLRFEPTLVEPMISAVFNAVQGTFAKASVMTRFEVYSLLDQLLSSHRADIKATGVDFINVLVELSSNERDPRNLMLIFSMVEVVLAEWEVEDIEQLQEDLYDLLSRYFPITFSAKKSDPAGIDPAELVLRLRKCFAAYSGFAPSIFPNLIQRLDDPNRLNAKADVLLTMKACIKRYHPETVEQWSGPLWDALKYEILNSTDDSQAPKALAVLRSIATRLSADLTLQTIPGTVLYTYVLTIVDECMTRLRENAPKYSASAGAIMESIIAASPFAYHLVMRTALPVLLREFAGDEVSVDERRAVVETINSLLDGKFEVLRRQANWEFSAVSIIDGLSYRADGEFAGAAHAGQSVQLGVSDKGFGYYRDELTAMYMRVARDTQVDSKQSRVAAVQGLAKMLRLPQFLERGNVDSYIQFLAGVVLETPDAKEPVRREAIKALQDCAIIYASLVMEKAFPVLLASLPDVLEGSETVREKLAVLEALGDIGSCGTLMETLFRRLLSKLDIVVHANETQQYGHLVLAGILYTVEQREAQNETGVVKERDVEAYRSLVDELLRRTAALKADGEKWYVGARNLETAAGKAQPDDTFFDLVGKVIMKATWSMGFDDQDWMLERAFTLNVKEKALSSTQFAVTSGPADKLQVLSLSKFFLAALRRDDRVVTKPAVTRPPVTTPAVTKPIASPLSTGPVRKRSLSIDTSAAAADLITYLTTTASTPAVRSTLLDTLSLVINKFGALTPGVKTQLMDLFAALPTLPAQEAKLTIQTLTTSTHAALLAGLPASADLGNCLLSALALPAPTGQLAAQAFTHLLAPSPILTRTQHALIRPIAQQRFFHTAVPQLITAFSTADSASTKTNALVALSGLLGHAPEEYITPFIDALIPLLLQSLDSAPGTTKKASIAVLRSAAASSPKALQAHDAALVKRLLVCAQGKGNREVKVKALECLEILPAVWETAVVVRLRGGVVAGLGSVVGDVSRDVRRGAVDCLAAWWRVGEGDGN